MQPNLLDKIIHIYSKPARVAILMSGKGSNASAVLANANRYKDLQFISIITDRKDSNAHHLCNTHHLKYFCLDDKIKSQADREQYFLKLSQYLNELQIDTLIYAGFMKISTASFVKQHPGINIHPADLSITDVDGKPKYIGMHSVRDAILAGEKYVASTAHIVDAEVDCGTPLLISKHLLLDSLPTASVEEIHEKLKSECEHALLPKTLELLTKEKISPNQLPYQWDQIMVNMGN